jgi:tetratricopeptide (TPR) repeat protein
MGTCCSKASSSSEVPLSSTTKSPAPQIESPVHSAATEDLGTLPFPKLGVRLDYLNQFINSFGGEAQFSKLTTTDVCEKFVKPLTLKSQLSMCEFLQSQKSPMVGVANVFISHAWKYEFLEVVAALHTHFPPERANELVIWFDLFSNNQHLAPNLTFDWWSNTFKSAIDQFHYTVVIFCPWNDPIPLTRAWCIWELYCTIITGSKLEVAMSKAQKSQFVHEIAKKSYDVVHAMLSAVDCERSESYKAEDKRMIHEVVKTTVGFDKINSLIFEKLRAWTTSAVEESLASLSVAESNEKENDQSMLILKQLELLNAQAQMALGTNNIPMAMALYAKGLEIANSIFLGMTNPASLTAMNGLGMALQKMGNFPAADNLFQKCYEGRTALLGEANPQTLLALNNLALCKEKMGDMLKAELLYERCLQLQISTLGKDNLMTLETINNLAGLYYQTNKNNAAKDLWVDCYQHQQTLLGEDHHDTLQTMNNLSLAYNSLGEFGEAEKLLLQCVRKSSVKMGPTSEAALSSKLNLFVLYMDTKQVSKINEAEFIELVEQSAQGYGRTDDTKAILERLVKYYEIRDNPKEARRVYEKYSGKSFDDRSTFDISIIAKLLNRAQACGEDNAAAEKIYKECLTYKDPLIKSGNSSVYASILNNTADALFYQHRYNEATPYYEESLALRRQLFGDSNGNTINSKKNVADNYKAGGKTQLAIPLYEEVLADLIQMVGENHQATKEVQSSLAACR